MTSGYSNEGLTNVISCNADRKQNILQKMQDSIRHNDDQVFQITKLIKDFTFVVNQILQVVQGKVQKNINKKEARSDNEKSLSIQSNINSEE